MPFSFLKKIYYRRFFRNKKTIKIVGGASDTKFSGWTSLNIEVLDITKEKDWNFIFKKRSIDNILLEHVVEHLKYNDFIKFLQTVKKYLKVGAVIRIAVPDKYHPSQYVRDLTGVNGLEPGADDHKYFYCINDFEKIGNENGFLVNKIEYFDESGAFNSKDFNFDNGYVSRCSKNYKGRFTDSKEEYSKMMESTPENLRSQFDEKHISYTSLFVDFINK